MNARLALRFALMLLAGFAPIATLRAQVPAIPAPDVAKLPPIPIMKSPVDSFRELLAMSADAREKSLANRSPEIRRRILAKLGEYEAMKPDERELRLRATQLRWQVLTLVQLPAAGRATQLAALPETDRKLVGDRLQAWDQMPSDEQAEVLKYEKTMEQLADQHLDASVASAASARSSARPEAFQKLDDFLQLPGEQRRQMFASFQRFFELSEAEKQKTLGALSDGQRTLTTGTLQALDKMSPEEREQYMSAVNRFSNMTATERREFVKNAEEWQQLSPAEKQAWRSFVKHTLKRPPMPPGFAFPPMPPGASLQVNATNRSHPSP